MQITIFATPPIANSSTGAAIPSAGPPPMNPLCPLPERRSGSMAFAPRLGSIRTVAAERRLLRRSGPAASRCPGSRHALTVTARPGARASGRRTCLSPISPQRSPPMASSGRDGNPSPLTGEANQAGRSRCTPAQPASPPIPFAWRWAAPWAGIGSSATGLRSRDRTTASSFTVGAPAMV